MGNSRGKDARDSDTDAPFAPAPTLDTIGELNVPFAVDAFSVMQFNVWFELFQREARFAELKKEISTRAPSLVCLQECTPWFQRMWQSDPSLEAVYRGLWVPSTHPYQYYTAILVRISDDSTPVNLAKVTCQRVGFEERLTVQGRDIVWIRLQFEDWALVVATVHLESRVNAPAGARNVQQVGVLLQTLRAHCGPKDIVVITGDTNEDANFPPSESPANALYVQDTIDVWSTVHPSDLGYTEDTKINTMRAAFRDEAKFCRLDRVLLLKSEGLRRVRARSIERLGTEAFGRTELGVSVFISDHFGLFAEFEPAAGAIAVGVATPAAGSTPVATPVAAGATAADAAPAAAARPLAAGDSSISSSSSYDSN